MSSKRSYQVGLLQDWLTAWVVEEMYDNISRPDPETIEMNHLVQFNTLCQELSPKRHAHSLKDAALLYNLPQERVLCLWSKSKLIATAQASLLFPGLVPTVHISNVVVAESERGDGHGKTIVLLVLRFARNSWWPEHRPLSFQLTSQEKRGTRGFYVGLGFKPTPTIRYVK